MLDCSRIIIGMISFNSARWTVFVFLLLVLLVLFILVPVSFLDVSTDSEYVTHTWKTDPIVAVYIPTSNQGIVCAPDYEAVSVPGSLKTILEGPCGCVDNDLGFQSSNASCSLASKKSSMCMTLKSLPKVTSSTWRNSIVCIKRDGQAAATNKAKYKPRPHPNKNGFCPNGYKKCGEGLNQQEGAVCFPLEVDCPITNMLVLPSNVAPPANAFWETAGTFPGNNHTLFVRREYYNELPIIDIAFRLSENDAKGGGNMRGVCYEGAVQVINSSVIADPSKLWSYNIAFPPLCAVSNQRYVLVDQVPIQDHFLQNLQLTEPACEGFALYPLSEPRYQPALDPDYLNSGVKCDFTSKYTCVRDPYQRTDCAAGDYICDGVVNQNVCGEYAHAVRSAFPENSVVNMGMFIQREVQWTDGCNATKAGVFHAAYILFCAAFVMIFPAMGWGMYNLLVVRVCCSQRFKCDHVAVSFLMVCVGMQLMLVVQVVNIYKALEDGNCTDSFTRETLLDRLEPIYTSLAYIVTFMCVLFVLMVDAIVMHCGYYPHEPLPPPLQAPLAFRTQRTQRTPRTHSTSRTARTQSSQRTHRQASTAPTRAQAQYQPVPKGDMEPDCVDYDTAAAYGTPVADTVVLIGGAPAAQPFPMREGLTISVPVYIPEPTPDSHLGNVNVRDAELALESVEDV